MSNDKETKTFLPDFDQIEGDEGEALTDYFEDCPFDPQEIVYDLGITPENWEEDALARAAFKRRVEEAKKEEAETAQFYEENPEAEDERDRKGGELVKKAMEEYNKESGFVD